jgi:hypothetical protein
MNLTTAEIETYIRACYDAAESKGWHANVEDDIDAKIANLHGELSEALEEYRAGHDVGEIYYNLTSDHPDKPEGVPVELADFAIRLFDLCGMLGCFSVPIFGFKYEGDWSFCAYLNALHGATTYIMYACLNSDASANSLRPTLAIAVEATFAAAEKLDIDLRAAIDLKMAYNASRERRHGGKVV